MIEERHRRLHRHTRRINFIAVPIALIALGGWAYLRLFICWGQHLSETEAMVCGYSALMPMLFAVAVAVGIVLIARELRLLSRELEGGEHHRGSRVLHGLRSLSPAHRRHVWTSVVLVIGLTAFEIWLFSRFEIVMPR